MGIRHLGRCINLVLLTGCGAQVEVEVEDRSSASQSLESAGEPPPAVAKLELPNGNLLEFYDFGRRALIMESGQAYSPPAFRPDGPVRVDELVQVWTSVAPGVSVPQELRDLQDRLAKAKPTPHSRGEPTDDAGGGGQPTASEGPELLAPTGCNNGCCDFEWMESTFFACHVDFYDYQWMLFNYGYSHYNGTSVWSYTGFVCSASGTSNYKVNVVGEGLGGNWSVPQATWRTWSWIDGICPFCSDEDIKSNVNTSSNQHLHTYCGAVNH